MDTRCENCGVTDTELSKVKRIYLEIDPFDKKVVSTTTVSEIELWCYSCQTIYPNQLVDLE